MVENLVENATTKVSANTSNILLLLYFIHTKNTYFKMFAYNVYSTFCVNFWIPHNILSKVNIGNHPILI